MPPPHRWNKYSCIGQRIPNTRFIAFKVPLKPVLCKGLPDPEKFTTLRLIEDIKSRQQELKLVIDLTNTNKYYHPNEITKHGIKYKKLYTVGHSVPNSTVVRLFTTEVDDFLAKNSDSDSLVGVHCTHGVNRTGYLICRYMIDKLQFTPDAAIEAFANARGHPIERENYIRDLKKRCVVNSNTKKIRDHEKPYNRSAKKNLKESKRRRNTGYPNMRVGDDVHYYPEDSAALHRADSSIDERGWHRQNQTYSTTDSKNAWEWGNNDYQNHQRFDNKIQKKRHRRTPYSRYLNYCKKYIYSSQ